MKLFKTLNFCSRWVMHVLIYRNWHCDPFLSLNCLHSAAVNIRNVQVDPFIWRFVRAYFTIIIAARKELLYHYKLNSNITVTSTHSSLQRKVIIKCSKPWEIWLNAVLVLCFVARFVLTFLHLQSIISHVLNNCIEWSLMIVLRHLNVLL